MLAIAGTKGKKDERVPEMGIWELKLKSSTSLQVEECNEVKKVWKSHSHNEESPLISSVMFMDKDFYFSQGSQLVWVEMSGGDTACTNTFTGLVTPSISPNGLRFILTSIELHWNHWGLKTLADPD